MANFEPVPHKWADVDMWRCPAEKCGFATEDKDVVQEHIEDTGHFGPDDADAVEAAERLAEEAAQRAKDARANAKKVAEQAAKTDKAKEETK